MTALPPLAVAALSTAALALLLAHRRANLGGRNAAGFVAAALAYGWIRSTAIARVSAAASAQTPYQIVSPLVSLFGVPLQELVGWTSATLISSYVADRLLRRLGRTTDAWSLALVAGCRPLVSGTSLLFRSVRVGAPIWGSPVRRGCLLSW